MVTRFQFIDLFIDLHGKVSKLQGDFEYFGNSYIPRNNVIIPGSIRIVDEIFCSALELDATDIQIDRELIGEAKLGFRVDGIIQKVVLKIWKNI